MGTTVESGVREGALVQTPNLPTKTDRKLRASERTVAKEVGQSRQNDGFGYGGKP